MAKQTLPRIITPQDLTEFFEEDPTPIIGKGLVRFSDTASFLETSQYERKAYKLDRNGNPLPLNLNNVDSSENLEYQNSLDEGHALSDDEDIGLSLDDLDLSDLSDLDTFSNYTS
jgi:hypothetical protein